MDLVGASVRWCSPEEYRDHRDLLMEEMAREAEQEGFSPYIIPEGGSNGLGALGYVRAITEIATELAERGSAVDSVVCAVGSGGTYAGLCAGRNLAGLDTAVIGFNVCDTAEVFRARTGQYLSEVSEILGIDPSLGHKNDAIIDGYVGPGYAQGFPASVSAIHRLAREEGIFLDPVYTGKAFAGLLGQLERRDERLGRSIIFVHTGGIFGLFSQQQELFADVENR